MLKLPSILSISVLLLLIDLLMYSWLIPTLLLCPLEPFSLNALPLQRRR
jgi:hypothetical protein